MTDPCNCHECARHRAAERAVLDAAREWGRARAAFDAVPDPDEDSPEFVRSGEAYVALGRAVAALLAEEVERG